jgi:hypothetical protein
MFKGCTGLTKLPTLSATSLATECYYGMFNGCTGLTEISENHFPDSALNIVVADYCYGEMFANCSNLSGIVAFNNIKNLKAVGIFKRNV